MIVVVILFILSFLMDGIIFSLSSINAVAAPLFSLLALIIAYPYCQDDPKKLYISAITIGVLYDIVYTNSLFLNTLLFVGVVYFIDKLFRYLTNNFFNTMIVSTVVICLYRILFYSFYCIIGVVNFEVNEIIDMILRSFIINYIYIFIFHFLLLVIAKKFKIKRLL